MKQTAVRFWEKVDIKEPEECWEWQASTFGGRYGSFKYKGKSILAHRFAYILAYGSIKDGLQILHKCDNMRCVNPKHLYEGTQSDNMKDRSERNPVSPELFGSGKTKLFSWEISSIRELHGKLSSRDAAELFNVSFRTVLTIWNSNKHLCKEGYYA